MHFYFMNHKKENPAKLSSDVVDCTFYLDFWGVETDLEYMS